MVTLAGKPQTFIADLSKANGRLYLPVPFDPDSTWGRKPRHHVNGMLNGQRFRGVIEYLDGVRGLIIGPALQRDRAWAEGDRIVAQLDAEGPQRAALAEDIALALAAAPAAAEFFDGLAQFYRKAYLAWIDTTKRNPQLRAERINQVVVWLTEGRKQRP